MKQLSLRRNFAWNFVGTITYNLVLWLLIVALAQAGSAAMVGQYALTLAITAPVFMLLGLNLRVVRATDVVGAWDGTTYRRLRAMLNAGSIGVSLAAGFALGLRGEELAVLGVVALSKGAESTSLLLYGLFQLRERLDLVARSMLLRAAVGGAGFVAALLATDRLLAACIGLGVGWLAVYVVHDRAWERRLARGDDASRASGTVGALARKAFPLGLDAGVASLATNVPRFAVETVLGTAALGLFAGLAYLSQVVSMIAGTLSDVIVGPLAKVVASGNVQAFRTLLRKLVMFGLAVAGVGAVGAALLGGPVIGLLLGEEFINQPALVTLMVGAGAITTQRCLSRGLQAAHKFWWVMSVDAVILLLTVGAAAILVPAYGLTGAAGSLGLGFLGGAVVTMVLLRRVMKSMEEQAA